VDTGFSPISPRAPNWTLLERMSAGGGACAPSERASREASALRVSESLTSENATVSRASWRILHRAGHTARGSNGGDDSPVSPRPVEGGCIVGSRWMSWGPASQPGGPDGGLMVRRFGGSSPPLCCSPPVRGYFRPAVSPAAPRATQRSTRESDRLEQPHGSIRMEPRMARISAASFRGEAGDQFASIIRRVPSTSRIQNSSLRPGSPL